MNAHDTAKADFIATWPDGYVEGGFVGNEEADVVYRCLTPFFNPEHVALEIGCGGGLWTTRYLIPQFKHVIALDVIPQPSRLTQYSLTYIEVGDRDFDCTGVADESVDFVWSFGVFCHLSGAAIRSYLSGIHRVLKPNGNAVVMFGNWPKRGSKEMSEDHADKRDHGDGVIWFYCDEYLARKWCDEAGFGCSNLMPDYWHTMLHLRKRV